MRARQQCTRAGSSGSHETAGALLRGMHELGLPCFELESASLRMLHTPGELYAALLAGAQAATRRVSLASLYLGTGPLEHALVAALATGGPAAAASHGSLASGEAGASSGGGGGGGGGGAARQVHVLLDYHRGTRLVTGGNSLATLAPLAACPGATVELFAPPPPRGALPRLVAPLLPQRLAALREVLGVRRMLLRSPAHTPTPNPKPNPNQVLGVQHMKAAVFDDAVLLTGANLSAEYFEARQASSQPTPTPTLTLNPTPTPTPTPTLTLSRQDRALLISDAPDLADFVCALLRGVGACGARLEPRPAAAAAGGGGGGGYLPPAAVAVDAAELAEAVEAVMVRARAASPPPPAGAAQRGGCWLLPSVQFAPAGLTLQAESTTWLLSAAAPAAAAAAAPAAAAAAAPHGTPHGALRAATPPPRALPLLLSSPYLNLPPQFADALLPPAPAPAPAPDAATAGCVKAAAPARLVVAASPYASSFHRAGELKGLEPYPYPQP